MASKRGLSWCAIWCVAAAWAAAGAAAGDWPQILGPSRNGMAAQDERLADAWPAAGPTIEWQRTVGSGYAGVAVAGDTGVLFHRLDDREVVEAFDVASGKTRWADGHPTTFRPQVGNGDGPLCVPLIHADKVITFGAQGVLSCHALATGKLQWRRDTHRDFAAPEGYFGAGACPLVVGNAVIVNVGGARKEAGIVGFDVGTGDTLWQATSEPASYASPVRVDFGGTPLAVMITRYQCLLLEPRTGAVRWQFPFGMRGPTVNASMPLVTSLPGDEAGARSLLVTAAYGIGSVAGSFTADAFTKRWEGVDALASQYCTPIAIGDHAYCIDGRDDVPPTALTCVEIATGRVAWREADFGYGTLLHADGTFLATKTDGELALIEATPTGMTIVSRARPLPGTLRALPALAAGRLFVRDDSMLACLDVREPVPPPAPGAGRSRR